MLHFNFDRKIHFIRDKNLRSILIREGLAVEFLNVSREGVSCLEDVEAMRADVSGALI